MTKPKIDRADEYRKAIARLGMGPTAAGRALGVSPRTAAIYAAKGPPELVARLLRLLLRHKIPISELR